MKRFRRLFSIKFFLFLIVLLLGVNSILLLRQNFKTPTNLKHFLFKEGDKILEGLQTGPEEITVDFAKQISTGSPLVFGGSHNPPPEHQDAWNKLQEIGVTMIRRDFFVQYEAPNNISPNIYRNNLNDVQNQKYWNLSKINLVSQNYENAKKRDMKVIGIMAYSPFWLTKTNKPYSPPTDWDIYENIVKKIYRIHRNQVDHIEIWNEPDHDFFMDLTGYNITGLEAYKQIYIHASKAIREVDSEINDGKRIKLGGPVISNFKDLSYVEMIISDPEIKDNIDFISLHYYGYDNYDFSKLKKLLKKYSKENLPIFVTEWNHSGNRSESDSYIKSDISIPYTGEKLLNFLKEGIVGANYFALVPIGNQDPSYNYYGFYYWRNNKADLLPMSNTWRLLSKSMILGKGESKIYEAKSDKLKVASETREIGFENINGEKGVAIVNDTDHEKYYRVVMKNIDKKDLKIGKYPIDIYIASAEYDGGKAIDRLYVTPDKEGNLIFTLLLPPLSVGGVLEVKETNPMEILKEYIP